MKNLAFHCLLRWKMIIPPILTTSLIHFSSNGWENVLFEIGSEKVNPFTPESDQCQNSPAASQEIWHHTVWRTWLFIANSHEKWLYYKFSLHHSHNRFLKGWENTLFELRSERVKDALLYLDFSFCMVFSEVPDMSDPKAEFLQQQYKQVSNCSAWVFDHGIWECSLEQDQRSHYVGLWPGCCQIQKIYQIQEIDHSWDWKDQH